MEAGTYRSQLFADSFAYTVPDGWRNEADDPTGFVLSNRSNSPENIELVTDVHPPVLGADGCMRQPTWDRPHAAEDLVSYLAGRPDIDATATPVSMGGLDGFAIRAAMRPDATGCGDVGLPFYVIHWYDGIPVTNGLGHGYVEAIVLDGHHGRTIAISNRVTDSRLVSEAAAIVESLEFAP